MFYYLRLIKTNIVDVFNPKKLTKKLRNVVYSLKSTQVHFTGLFFVIIIIFLIIKMNSKLVYSYQIFSISQHTTYVIFIPNLLM